MSGGTAFYTVSSLNAGSHSITSSYSGDATFAPSVSRILTQRVSQATSAATLSSNPNPSYVNQPVMLTATVTGQYGGTPTGSVTFQEGKTVLGTAPLVNAQGTVTYTFLANGKFEIRAAYSGDSNYKASNSGQLVQTVANVPPSLSFPLINKTAYSAVINAVFDHSMDIAPQNPIQWGYCPDGVVTAYTGEQGVSQFSSSLVATFTCGKPTNHPVELYGYQQANAIPFRVNGHYAGGLAPSAQTYLFYDGHPGFDYRTTDQDGAGNLCGSPDCNMSGETPVVAAAPGTVVCVNISTKTKAPCIEGPGEIKIEHSGGYYTVYLHLSATNVSAGDSVAAQQQIGVSGNTGAEGGAHLHFEVRQGATPVDPYGWSGTSPDPYTRAVNINLWQ